MPLGGLGAAPITGLAERIVNSAPAAASASLALVDSPRWPRDLDWSRGAYPRLPAPPARELDTVMRQVYRTLVGGPNENGRTRSGAIGEAAPGGRAPRALSMFPTPPCEYFMRCARDPRCKPHLAAIARELFGPLIDNAGGAGRTELRGGAVFTRFMLAGFATYRALEQLGLEAFESYPDLQFRLSAPSTALAPKSRHAEALAVRKRIVARLARELGVEMPRAAVSLDQLDAAVLALAAAKAALSGALAVAQNPCEGRFMFALDAKQANRIGVESA